MEHVGLEALENEVAEKKRRQIFDNVAKACSVGAQMTLIMGGGALLFRWDGRLSPLAIMNACDWSVGGVDIRQLALSILAENNGIHQHTFYKNEKRA